MDFYYFQCFEVESYYIDSNNNESFHYHGNMKIDLYNKVHFGQDGKIWPFEKIAKYEEINGELNNISGICTTSYPPMCQLDMTSLEKSYFSLDIKEAFDFSNETKPEYTLSTHIELHFDQSNEDSRTFSGKDENGNLICLILKEVKCSDYNVKDKLN